MRTGHCSLTAACTARPIAAAAVAVLLLAACSKPTPDTVVRRCLDAIAAKNYDRAYSFCTPELRGICTNVSISKIHRTTTTSSSFTIERMDAASATSLHVFVRAVFRLHDQSEEKLFFRIDLVDSDKWYIEDVWLLNAKGLPTTTHALGFTSDGDW